ncbi:MAG: cytochrome c [Nitrospirae bacterium]|nr:MAG: cytochrome c [Nitrospirota bacterium]
MKSLLLWTFGSSPQIVREHSVLKAHALLTAVMLAIILSWPASGLAIFGFFESSKEKEPPVQVPPEYAGKRLPAGWESDPQILAAGKAIYEGITNPNVKCVDCHGVDGHPTRMGRGAPDFSNPAEAEEPDDLWFWRVSEGVPRTKMRGWKKYLSEEQRWQVIAYLRSLAKP